MSHWGVVTIWLTATLTIRLCERCGLTGYTIPMLLIFFFNDTATTEIYTLSLHDALPISSRRPRSPAVRCCARSAVSCPRSEEHTSELQSPVHLVCRLLLEKNKQETH